MKKKFKIDQTHGYIGEKKYKAKPKKPYVEPDFIKEYRASRVFKGIDAEVSEIKTHSFNEITNKDIETVIAKIESLNGPTELPPGF